MAKNSSTLSSVKSDKHSISLGYNLYKIILKIKLILAETNSFILSKVYLVGNLWNSSFFYFSIINLFVIRPTLKHEYKISGNYN